MAIVSISRIQHRRGLQQDLPSLASAELGWSIDEQRLYIGNGSLAEGAPKLGNTEILTEHSDILRLAQTYTFRNDDAGYVPTTGGRTNRFNSIATDGISYIIVGTNGTLLKSTDGATWSPIYASTTSSLNHVCYGDGKFVAVGANGTIVYSTDGNVWNTATTTVFLTLTSVVWAAGLIQNFVATATNGSVILSTDAITWSEVSTGQAESLNAIAYESDTLVAVGNNATVLYSTDANNWSAANLPPIGSSNLIHLGPSGYNFKAVAYTDDRWIASGDFSTVIISSDAVDWVYGYTDVFRASADDGSRWVFVGDGGVIYTTTSTSLTACDSGTILNLYDVIWSSNDGIFVAVGAAGTILTSLDGINWTSQTSTVSESLNRVYYDSTSGNYVIVGTNGTILSSTDTVSWVQETSGITDDLFGIAKWSTTTWIAVGAAGTIITSPNITTWTSQTSPTNEDLEFVSVADLGGGTFEAVAVGLSGTIITSSNSGVTWTLQTSGSNNDLHSVKYITYTYNLVTQSYYFAVGNNGTMLYSSDAVSWTSIVNIGATNHLFNISYGIGNFWITGSVGYGTIFGDDILDPLTMTIQSLSVVFTSSTGYNGPSLNAITYDSNNIVYVIAGQYDSILTSVDGQNFVSQTNRTFTLASLNTADIFGLLYADNKLIAVGNKGLILSSTDSVSWDGISYSFGDSKTVRTIQAKLDDYVSVKDFGAKGDGLTDDTEAINRALYEIYCRTTTNAARKRLLFPAGTYVISDGINVPTNAILVGEGASNTIIRQTSDPTYVSYVMITADSKRQIGAQVGLNGASLPGNVLIQDMTLQSNYDAIWLVNASRMTMLRVDMIGGQDLPTTAGSNWSGVYILGSTMEPPTDIDISHCNITGYNYGVYQPSTEYSRNIVFHSTSFSNCYEALNLCVDDGMVNTMTISNCVFDLIYGRAINCNYATNVVSTFNSYRDVANQYQGAGSPDDYIIYFGANSVGCASIADQFDRTKEDSYAIQQWVYGNSETTALFSGHELRVGLYERGGGTNYTLAANQTNEATGFTFDFDDNSYNKKLNYVINRNNFTRTGVLTVAYDLTTATYSLDDDSTENGDVGVVFSLSDDGTTVSLDYTSTATVGGILCTISEEYLKVTW